MRKIFVLTLFVMLSGVIIAQEKDPMVTDRPSQAESASIMDIRGFQIESGFAFEKVSSDIDFVTFNSTLLRYGLVENIELRLGVQYLGFYYSMDGLDIDETGFGPLTLGAKFLLLEESEGNHPQLALLSTFSVPKSGASAFENENLGADIRLNADYTISDAMTLGGNLGVIWSGIEGQDYAVWMYAAAIGLTLSDKLGAYAELYGFLPGEGKNDHRWDGGLTYAVTEDLQLDFSTGVGLSKVSPDFFISLGLSIRMP
ncbi:transporter [Marinifilum flexuosum]|uniref:Outer membrane putative beta-barrel porin/alpha-amylase n=1 Tax=Marinifilum flexuosum TaxID=1117708 RepID=A0A419X2X8_9BACT|nr:transporter [Marinifilum flexuosum]RKE02085.1 outer membrane putative beta-barrel porin/alpha-amylase [Marinifilum flexuosum]